MVRIFFLFLLPFVVSGWGACVSVPVNSFLISYSSGTCINEDNNLSGYYSECQTAYNGCPSTYSISSSNLVYTGLQAWSSNICRYTTDGCGWHERKITGVSCNYTIRCENHTEADSTNCLNNGNLWINGSCCDEKCVCQNSGGTWNESTNSCTAPCNDHGPEYQKCTQTWDNGYNEWDGQQFSGGGYWKINLFTCYYDSCAHVETCAEGSSFPAGSLSCDDFQNPDSTQNCIAAVGSGCTIGCPDGRTIYCDCDGSCDHAKTVPACQCPIVSSSSANNGQSSSSGDNNSSSSSANNGSSSSGENNSSSSSDGPNSSDSPYSNGQYNYSGVLNQIEYNTRRTANNTSTLSKDLKDIKENTAITAGYVSSIDRWQSTINRNNLQNTNRIVDAIESMSGALATDTATHGLKDSIHNSNQLLGDIKGALIDSSHGFDFDITGWKSQADSLVNKLQNPESTVVHIDSLKSDTSEFKTKYTSFFLHDVYTRNGCYEFKMAKPDQTSKFGRFFSSDVVVNFGNLAGTFDLCAIFRGLCRIAGAILVLLISIKSYRSAFSSSDG